DGQPADAANEKIAAAVFEWQLGLHNTMLARFLPPIKISVEVPLCVIELQTFPARIVLVFRKGCREVSQSVAPQRVRPQVEPYRQQCRTTSAKAPWRAYLDLDFRVTEKRRSNKVLDTLKKEYRRTSTAHRGQHKAARRGSVCSSWRGVPFELRPCPYPGRRSEVQPDRPMNV